MRPGDLLAAYRATGADLPFGDPRRGHGVGMEGYYWRFTDPAARRVIAVLCGICRAHDGTWAVVALAARPGGIVRHAVVPVARDDARRLAVDAGRALRAGSDHLAVDLGPGARLRARLEEVDGWPRRAFGGLGPAQALPGLDQYWHPHVLGARVSGTAELGEAEHDLGGSTAYAEKNWGTRFAGRWWWGQAHGFGDPGVCVAFAGGRVSLGPVEAAPTAVVVRLDDELIRLSPPLARTVAAVGADAWRLRAGNGRTEVEIEAGAGDGHAALLPVPLPAERRVEIRSRQLLDGHLRLWVRRGRRLRYAGESGLAGLEREAG